jgi:hypothetical protein
LKANRIFIVFISMFLVLLVGCSNGTKIAGDKIVVEKHVGKTDKYEYYNKIKDSKEVQKVKDILDSVSWENAKVSMVSPPNYKFHFEDTNEKQKSSELIYELWISPNKDKVELVVSNESKYVQLSKEKSAELFKIIAGKKLDDV